ncbi:hypothetical protein HPP92_023160 [Vanilla planifolia]|uniref:Uncharacterized protein n=1 Tax=Vanilla planifolia TaxID=51239 RepID=A0A835Q218_VANPL|nr:hypothetical protein HPP92_023160 [Vanilla planifolia]
MLSMVLVHPWWSPPLPVHRDAGRRAVGRGTSPSPLSKASTDGFVGFCSPLLRCPFPAQAEKHNSSGGVASPEQDDILVRKFLQALLWTAEIAYILWLFLLPYAPGDPVWAIKSNTVSDLLGLSLNFFFILPLLNSIGVHVIEAPTLHPVAEGLFNFVIGWTFLFAPLLFTDRRRDRYRGSLDLLWVFQMFLTNTFLIPYMAIRLDDITDDEKKPLPEPPKLGPLMTNGATVVGLIGGCACLVSVIWAFFGRAYGGFGDVSGRWRFLEEYIQSERLAYAFLWDVFLYTMFQPWLIGDNLENVKNSGKELVRLLRFLPVMGIIAYLLFLDNEKEV